MSSAQEERAILFFLLHLPIFYYTIILTGRCGMRDFLNIVKALLLVFTVALYLSSADEYIFFILFVLGYISLNLLPGLPIKHRAVIAVIHTCNIVLIWSAFLINPVIMLLYPIALFEFTALFDRPVYYNIVVWIPLFLLPSELYLLFGLITALSFMLFYLYQKWSKLSTQSEQEIDALKQKLRMNADYENQIRIMAALDTKNRISQEIHDKLGHTITGSVVQLEAAKVIAEQNPKDTVKIIDNVTKVMREGFLDIRALLKDEKPTAQTYNMEKL
ncbi:MAG: hypothetical protein BGN88_10470, partial [Clostridiales bacterium 43-6]